jgi:hypothetical protein
MTIRWEEITPNDLTSLEKVLKLYDLSFPIEVREPHHIFIRSLEYVKTSFPNQFRLLVGFEGDGLVSFATGHYLAEVNSGFIVYIATDPLQHSKGLGSKTLLKIEELLNKDAQLAGNDLIGAFILETEKEEFAHSIVEKENCMRRSLFFQKNHYQYYEEVEYLQPPLHEEGESIPLNLFIKNIQSDRMKIEEVNEIIRSIYKEKYYNVNGIDKNILNRCLKEIGI